ncbi:MAG: DHH family phosphoesterase [Thermacetogeniaceae bacterium]
MNSTFYRRYKQRFFIGTGALLAIICSALALSSRLSDTLMLAVFGFLLASMAMAGLAYVDKKEIEAREREARERLPGASEAAQPVAVPSGRRLALALIQIDDYDEVFQEVPEEKRPLLVGAVDKFLRDWAAGGRVYIRKDGRDRYLALIPEDVLADLEGSDFAVFEQLKRVKVGEHLPVTMSIGIGKGVPENDPARLGQLASQALELALARGGDQIVVKSPEHTWFYGGRSEAIVRRSQVRARIAATELDRLFKLCRSVVIMGHKGMDFDSFGAAVGLAEAAARYGKGVRVVVDHPGGAIERMYELVRQKSPGLLAEGSEVEEGVTSQTLLLLVDVHRSQMVPQPSLITRAGYIGVIDHHRRGEEFLERTNLVFIDPAASSACEMVTELLRYLPGEFHPSSLAATALLAGIVVDTKKFTFSTTARTYRAAALLRDAGARQGLIRSLFTDSLEAMRYRAELLQRAEIFLGKYAVAGSEERFPEAHVAASRAADTLLEVEGVAASFVFYPVDGGVGISARSNGSVNVHRIMEKMGGGGHFTVAGAKLQGMSMDAARARLLEILERTCEEEG